MASKNDSENARKNNSKSGVGSIRDGKINASIGQLHSPNSQTQLTFSSTNDRKLDPNASNSNILLQSTSTRIDLREDELIYLKQYVIDSHSITQLQTKFENLYKSVKKIKNYINDKIAEDQSSYIPYIIKIQAWYRGSAARIALDIPANKRYINLSGERIRAAIKIQSLWREYKIRSQIGVGVASIGIKELVQRHEIHLNDLRELVAQNQEFSRKYQSIIDNQSNTLICNSAEIRELKKVIEIQGDQIIEIERQIKDRN